MPSLHICHGGGWPHLATYSWSWQAKVVILETSDWVVRRTPIFTPTETIMPNSASTWCKSNSISFLLPIIHIIHFHSTALISCICNEYLGSQLNLSWDACTKTPKQTLESMKILLDSLLLFVVHFTRHHSFEEIVNFPSMCNKPTDLIRRYPTKEVARTTALTSCVQMVRYLLLFTYLHQLSWLCQFNYTSCPCSFHNWHPCILNPIKDAPHQSLNANIHIKRSGITITDLRFLLTFS
jgi:hypothetical protein